MRVVAVVSTKGGVGKTTVAANLGGLLADAGLRVLLLDLDSQPTLSNYYPLNRVAPGGVYELIALNQSGRAQVISSTAIAGLDLILSNDDQGHLGTLLLRAPDGRLRLRNLLAAFRPDYDQLLIDTQGARSVLLEMAVLACDLALSPITPEMLAARELRRGTLQLFSDLLPYRHLGLSLPPLRLLLNQVEAIRVDARLIMRSLRDSFADVDGISVLNSRIPARVAYLNAATLGLPVHRLEPRRATINRTLSPQATMQALAIELFPEWRERLSAIGQTHSKRP